MSVVRGLPPVLAARDQGFEEFPLLYSQIAIVCFYHCSQDSVADCSLTDYPLESLPDFSTASQVAGFVDIHSLLCGFIGYFGDGVIITAAYFGDEFVEFLDFIRWQFY